MATAEPQEERPQAGPLPSKRGEIGFQEGVHAPVEESEGSGSGTESSGPVPARHPADTPLPPTVPTTSEADATPSTTNPTPPTADTTPRPTSPSSSVNSTSKLASFFHCKQIPAIKGLRVTTLAIFVTQILILGGTIAGWVVLIERMQSQQSNSSSSSNSSQQGGNGSDSNASGGLGMGSALIFVYVAFAVMSLVQIIFLERTFFRLRVERYAFVHPGEILPSARNRQQARAGIAFVPWNRASLPTYAAALAQSGVGTGDVEDNIIAVPPPPAYGDTRASTLLLAGAIPDRLRRVRDSIGSGSIMSWTSIRRISVVGNGGRDSRPVSYMSRDPAWEERLDAEAAARLEETLAKQEEGDVTDEMKTHETH